MSQHDPSAAPGDPSAASPPPEEGGRFEPGTDAEGFSWRGWVWGFVQRTFVLLALYVLSIGPMYWQWYGGRFAGGSQLVAAFYEPLFFAANLVPRFGEWMDWYVGLWIG